MGTDSGNKPDATGVRSKAYWWEMLGLLIVLAGGVLLIGTLVTAIKIKSGWMAEESINSAKNRKIEKVSVVVRELTPETVVDRIRLPGMVRPWIEVKVPAEVSGQVLEKPVDKGALVKKAQVLLRIDPKDYRIALDRARSTLNLARQNFARTEKLLKQGVRTPSDRDNDYNALKQAETEVEAAELALARCTITSPSDGVVDDILPEIGEFLNVGAHVATVLDCGRVKVIIGIPEIDIDAVRKVKECEVKVSSVENGRIFPGAVSYLSLQPREEALVYSLELKIDNKEGLLRPGMFAEADIVKGRRPGSLMVPLYALLAKGDHRFAFVAEEKDGQTVARLRDKLELGVIQGLNVEILSGLNPGEKLIVMGHRSVSDGAPVEIVSQSE
jgi:membrane fusion protein (multidrug efflux system)